MEARPVPPVRPAGAVAAVAALGLLGACAPASDEVRLTVLAAASLHGVFDTLAADFEAEHPGVDVVVSYAGSADLADQVLAGAPADVLATADERTMARVVPEGDAVVFATNTLTVVTPADDPAGVSSLADLARPDVDVVVCAPEVPCGAATDAVADAAGVAIHRVSEEASVTDVLAKVEAGEADAGLVYVTDARAADVRVVETPEAAAVVNRYPVAVLPDAPEPELAAEFVALVTASPSALTDAGFGLP